MGPHQSPQDRRSVSDRRRRMPAPLPGWRRLYCSACSYIHETLAGADLPETCAACGRPIAAVSEAVGPRVIAGDRR